jgi:hypothetical protein
MLNFSYPLCKLPTGGDLLKLSDIIDYVKPLRDFADRVGTQVVIRGLLWHEGHESDCSASTRQERGSAVLNLESRMHCRNVVGCR